MAAGDATVARKPATISHWHALGGLPTLQYPERNPPVRAAVPVLVFAMLLVTGLPAPGSTLQAPRADASALGAEASAPTQSSALSPQSFAEQPAGTWMLLNPPLARSQHSAVWDPVGGQMLV